jgi:hypothetical protein
MDDPLEMKRLEQVKSGQALSRIGQLRSKAWSKIGRKPRRQ